MVAGNFIDEIFGPDVRRHSERAGERINRSVTMKNKNNSTFGGVGFFI